MTNLAELLKAPGASLECEDDFEAVNELVRGRGWSDGLPVVPPTAISVPATVVSMPSAVMLSWSFTLCGHSAPITVTVLASRGRPRST